MTLDPRVPELLRRECATIRSVRDPALKHALAQIKGEMTGSGITGSRMVIAVDKRCATELLDRDTEYLDRVLRRLSELREPWTETLRTEIEALLTAELMHDWNWLIGIRENEVGSRLRDHNSGQIKEALDTALRGNEDELAFRVLREERRRLPIAELLAAPRYAAVAGHWELANEYAGQSPPADSAAAREALLALEALARLTVDDATATLGDALKDLRPRMDDAGQQLLSSIEKIWNFSNIAPSIRHGGGSGDPVTQPEAHFVVGVTREAIRFLLTLDLG
jgi:hypothetical protein